MQKHNEYIEAQGWITTSGDVSLRTAIKNYETPALYQSDELNKALRHLKSWRTALDVGAHIGMLSYQMSKKFNKIHAFEIDSSLYHCFETNLKTQNVSNVELHKTGLGNTNESVSLVRTTKTLSTHVASSPGSLPITTLDSFNITDVDFIKIDVEGYETKVLEGGLQTIANTKPLILFENKGHGARYGQQYGDPIRTLAKLGYRPLEWTSNVRKSLIMTADPKVKR